MSTNYTGLAGVHSEVATCTAARNKAFDRRVSDTMTTEQVLHMKQLNSIGTSKKSLEQSMLAYAQKMKSILDSRTNKSEQTKNPTSDSKDNAKWATLSHKPASQKLSRNLPFIYEMSNDVSIGKITDSSRPQAAKVSQNNKVDNVGRVSIDSGISVDYTSESSDTPLEGYFSDTECQRRHSETPRDRDRSSSPERTNSRNSVLSTQSECIRDSTNNARRRRERRKRFGACCKPELPTVHDTEHTAEDNDTPEYNPSSEVYVNIAPFPDMMGERDALVPSYLDLSENVEESEDLERRTKILNPLTNTRNWVNRDNNNNMYSQKHPPPPSVMRPKVIHSPSVSNTRLRRVSQNKKQSKPYHKLFRYSDYVENADSETDRDSVDSSSHELSSKLSLPSLTDKLALPSLTDSEFEEILAEQLERLSEDQSPKPTFRERGSSLPVRKTRGVVTLLGNLEENDTAVLKSVLKTATDSENYEKKSVRFQLPDIYQPPNTYR